MVLGQHGSQGGVEEERDSQDESEDVDDMQENDNSTESMEDVDDFDAFDDTDDIQKDDNEIKSITGTSLKRGWTSSDHSLLKGIGVSVKEDSRLLLVNLEQDRTITLSYDIVLADGEYKIIYLHSGASEEVLQEDKIVQAKEEILFTQGQNEILIISKDAVFSEINISIDGLEVSDFE